VKVDEPTKLQRVSSSVIDVAGEREKKRVGAWEMPSIFAKHEEKVKRIMRCSQKSNNVASLLLLAFASWALGIWF